METGTDRLARPSLPRSLAALIIGAIGFASVASLLWPAVNERLHLTQVPTGVGVVRRVGDDPEQAGRLGAVAPDFEWNAPGGATLTLGSLRGKTVIVNFWATWCVPCREEMPALERVAGTDDNLMVLAVDLQEDGERVRGFFDSFRLARLQPVLDLDGAVARRYAVFSLPTTFFVGPDGVIRAVHIGGPMTPEAITQGVSKARSGATLAP